MPTLENSQLSCFDTTINVARGGSGQALLFLHGAGGSANLKALSETLAEDYHLILPDHPGFGLSQQSNKLNSVGDLSFFYLDFIEKLNLKEIHLVGHSMGGWIAAEIAVRSTANLASLTLISSAGIHVKGVTKGDIFLWSPEELARNLYVRQELVDTMLSYEPSGDEIEIMLRNRVATARYAWHPRFYNPDLAKWLHRIDIPTLILWGHQDKIFPAEYATAFSQLIPHAQIEIIDRCGHAPHMDRPDEFFSRLKAFLSGEAS